MDFHRLALLSLVLTISLAALSSSSMADASAAHCVPDLQIKYGASPVFKIACASQGDCEFEPSQPMNASAIALIDVMATTVVACWQKAGLTTMVPVASPPSMNLFIQRYRAADEQGSEICTIAQLKPFGQDKLTTYFRAACDAPKKE